eukprot:sb/3464459/
MSEFCPPNGSDYTPVNHLSPVEEWRKMVFYLNIPCGVIGIALNALCLVYFLKHQRKGIGDQMLMGLCFSDITICLETLSLLAYPWKPHDLKLGFKILYSIFPGLVNVNIIMLYGIWFLRTFCILRPMVRLKPARIRKIISGMVIVALIGSPAVTYIMQMDWYYGLFYGRRLPEWGLKFAINFKKISISLLSVTGIFVVVLNIKSILTLTKNVSQLELARESENKKHAAVTVLIILSVQLVTMLILYGVEIYFIITMAKFETCDIEGDGRYVFVSLDKNQYELLKGVLLMFIQSTLTSVSNPIIHISRNRRLNMWEAEGDSSADATMLGALNEDPPSSIGDIGDIPSVGDIPTVGDFPSVRDLPDISEYQTNLGHFQFYLRFEMVELFEIFCSVVAISTVLSYTDISACYLYMNSFYCYAQKCLSLLFSKFHNAILLCLFPLYLESTIMLQILTLLDLACSVKK